MPILTLHRYELGDLELRYQAPSDRPGQIGMALVPIAARERGVPPREHLTEHAVRMVPARWQPMRAWDVDPLVHVQAQGHPQAAGFAQGRTLRGSPLALSLVCTQHEAVNTATGTVIRTLLRSEMAALDCEHRVEFRTGERGLRVRTRVKNTGREPLTLELLTSFSLGGMTPFCADDAAGRLRLHRFRSGWSAEGRHESITLEDLHLERSWTGHSVQVERFGQIGSQPVRGFFPFAAVEDVDAGVTWGAQLACPGSWQLELYRKADQVALSGGLADAEFGHWCKPLAPGEEFTSPEAFVTCSADGLDDLCDRLTGMHRAALGNQPALERELPVVFNEWCSSWGSPTHDNVLALADRLKGSGVRYLVIDDGWAERPGDGFQQNGDWIVNRRAFPQGLRALSRAIRERGLVPGIWFEFEVANEGSKAFAEVRHQLQRHGRTLQVGTRRFWDFRDPWVHDFLAERVIRLLRENELGYLKVDYNDSIGIGCDGAASLGEGLREHLAGVQAFFARLRAELPDLVIENCSSGGHRLEPSMLALTSMSSFSDAHETPAIPIIAANLHRLILPQQSQIWAVLRAGDAEERLCYSLAATFLGRMCLSGEIHTLSPAQWARAKEAIELYRSVAPVIAAGQFRRIGEFGKSYQHPTGWQAVIAQHDERALIVWHTFETSPATLAVPLPSGAWEIEQTFAPTSTRAELSHAAALQLTVRDWTGGAVVLRRQPST